MNLAVSNIAWPRQRDEEVARILVENGVSGVEIAPTILWPRPLESTPEERVKILDFWSRRGLRIVAFQALLFGRPDLCLFGAPEKLRELSNHLRGLATLASDLGATCLVFGSPKNRLKGSLGREAASERAADFFRSLGDGLGSEGIFLCLEPNPAQYGSDFLVDAAETAGLVERVGHPHVRLHLDLACLALAGEALEETLARHGDLLRHFHASEPFLSDIAESSLDHPEACRALAARGYEGWVSLEMRAREPFNPEGFDLSVRKFAEYYTLKPQASRPGSRA